MKNTDPIPWRGGWWCWCSDSEVNPFGSDSPLDYLFDFVTELGEPGGVMQFGETLVCEVCEQVIKLWAQRPEQPPPKPPRLPKQRGPS